MQTDPPKKKIYPVQVHVLHSLIQMIEKKIKYAEWMNERDFVEANRAYFEKMAVAVEENYRLNCPIQHAWAASKLYLEHRVNPEVIIRKNKVEDSPEGEDTFWQDYERIYRMDSDKYE